MKRSITIVGLLVFLIFISCENADDLLKKGNESFNQGNYEEATVLYTRAIKIKPSKELYASRGSAFSNLLKYNTAIEDLSAAINMDKDYYYAYFARGNAYYAIEDYEKAIKDLNFFTKFNTGNFEAYLILASSLYMEEQDKSALDVINEAINLDPERSNSYLIRGSIYLRNKYYSDARDDFNTVLKLEPENSRAISSLAQIKELEDEEALATLRRLFGNPTGDPYTDLYNFGYNLGMGALLGY